MFYDALHYISEAVLSTCLCKNDKLKCKRLNKFFVYCTLSYPLVLVNQICQNNPLLVVAELLTAIEKRQELCENHLYEYK